MANTRIVATPAPALINASSLPQVAPPFRPILQIAQSLHSARFVRAMGGSAMRMRNTAIYGVGLALMLGLAPASAQEPKYWPNEKISFPIDTDKLAALDP